MASDLPGNALANRETSRIAEREKVIEVPIPVSGGGADIPAITLADAPAIGAAPTTIRSDCTIQAFADGGGSIVAEPSLLAGGGAAARLALWDGGAFVPWGAGADGDVFCVVYSTTEDAFYIGGSFANVDGVACANIARLDCATHAVTPLGAGVDSDVQAIVLDEANGLAHIGGSFINAGGAPAARVATYDIGAGTWAAWGAGCDLTVYALALDTVANRCFVGGQFVNAGGAPASHIAEYAFGGGGVWSEPGGGLDDDVHALVWESVAGILYIGGTFAVVALHVATWDGLAFAQIGDGLDDTVFALAWRASTGQLYAGGAFLQDGLASIDLFRLAVWGGVAWSDDGGVLGQDGQVNSICVVEPDIYVGGNFYQHAFVNTHPLHRICRYIGGTTPLELSSGTNNTVFEMAADASGRVLVVGLFMVAGGENLPGFINYAARRDHIHGMPGIATADQSGFLSSRDWGQFDGRTPQNGFENRTDSALSMVGSDLQIAPTGASYDIYTNANLITKSAAEIAPIANDLTEHYVYFDTQGDPQVSLATWSITSDNVPIATVYRDGATYAVRDERHGWRRDRWWHLWAHATIGTRYASGLGGTFTNTTFSISQGVVYDEDISHDSGGAITRCRLWYRNAAGTAMRFESNIAEPWKLGGTPAIQYDTGAGLADVTVSRYVCSYVYMTNDIDYPIYIVVGQAQYTNVGAARNDPLPATPGQGTKEWKLLYRVIYQRNGATATYIEAADFREVSTGPGSSFTPASHTSLTNRDAANQHPPGAIEVGTAQYQYIVTGAAPFTPIWSTGFLNITAAKTLTCQNNLTLSGTDGKALTLTGSLTAGADTSITGGGTLALAGFTLTVPASGTAALGTGAANTLTKWSGVNTLSNIANAAGYLYNDGAGAFSYVATPAPAAHNILSASHGDSTAAAVVRGDIITGQGVSPKWVRLAVGSANAFLRTDGTDVAWSTGFLSITAAKTLTAQSTLTFAGTDNSVLYVHQFSDCVIVGESHTGAGTGSSGSTVFGYGAGHSLAAGAASNTIIGKDAGYYITTGDWNTIVGFDAGHEVTGSGNCFFGLDSGYSITTGTYNICIGYSAGYNASQKVDATNSICIGYNTYNAASNQIVLGNSSITSVLTHGLVDTLTDGSTGGFRSGASADVLWYRGGANLWQTPDSVTVDAGLNVGAATGAATGELKISSVIRQSTSIIGKASYNAGTQACASGSTVITFDTQIDDTDSIWAVGTPTQFFSTTAGYYAPFLAIAVTMSANAHTTRQSVLCSHYNGAGVLQNYVGAHTLNPVASVVNYFSITFPEISMAAGDYVTFTYVNGHASESQTISQASTSNQHYCSAGIYRIP